MKEHHKKKAKEAKKLGLNRKNKPEKDPGIPNDWPFKEQELKALEARRARAIDELELKKTERKERVYIYIYILFPKLHSYFCLLIIVYCTFILWRKLDFFNVTL